MVASITRIHSPESEVLSTTENVGTIVTIIITGITGEV
jgi:hypothetical protein